MRHDYQIRNLRFWGALVVAISLGFYAFPGGAQSCVTQADLDAATRNQLQSAALGFARQVAAGNRTNIQAGVAPQVAADAQEILDSVSSAAAKVKNATFTVRNLYLLDASDIQPGQSAIQFYCGAVNGPLHVVFTLAHLPQAKYAVAMVHATGIPQPQQMTIIFANSDSAWKLAGFANKPLTMAGHDGIWYWKQARAYGARKQDWNAYFYYTTAQFLVTPVDFISSPNLTKLENEENAAKPAELRDPMQLKIGARTYELTGLHTDSSLGGLDLVMRYATPSIADLAATRQQNIAVMQAMLRAHPELRQAFHGLWVYAVAPGQDPFGIELPMNQIP